MRLVTNIVEQRLKGAIDNRIAEEQARQRQAAVSASSQRLPQRRRPHTQNGSGSRVSSRQREQGNGSNEKGPDPSEFEPEFAIGDDDSAVLTRISTPLPEAQSGEVAQPPEEQQEEEGAERKDADGKPQETNGSPAPVHRTPELPTEVCVRLKKLERLEAKYGELLKAYRIAHAKIQVIGPFEATLRENTPLTNIGDPGAFVEYLNQVTTKSDMVLEEFKRVSGERDDFKKKAEQSEDAASQLRAEVAELKKVAAEDPQDAASEKPIVDTEASAPAQAESTVSAKEVTSPTTSVKSPVSASSRIPSFSLFSPRS